MILLLAVLTLMLGDVPPAIRRPVHSQPLAQRMTLVLSSDKPRYAVREAIHLKMTLSNTQKQSVSGFFMAAPLSPKSEIRYRRRGNAFAVYPYPGRKGGYGEAAVTLGPGERMTDEDILVFDSARQAFVFDQPGDYEFKVIYEDAPSEPNAVLSSNTLQVVVEQPSSSEEPELQAYTPGLALLTQFTSRPYYVPSATLQEALAFLDRFPGSVYRQGVEDGLLAALSNRIGTGRATDEERELYNRLKAERP